LNFQSAERVRFLLDYVNIFLLLLAFTRGFKIDTILLITPKSEEPFILLDTQ